MKLNSPIKGALYLLTFFFLLFVSLIGCSENQEDAPSETLITVTQEFTVTKEEVKNSLSELVSKEILDNPIVSLLLTDLKVAVLQYRTQDVDGNPITASGTVVMVPGTTQYDQLLSIQHVSLDLDNAPSLCRFYWEWIAAFRGYVVVTADYLGYGVSRRPDALHPYLHISSTGKCCADMLTAAEAYLRQKGIKAQTNKVLLAGYSQGAHATLSTLLELRRRGEIGRVTDVFAGGGPYNLKALFEIEAQSGSQKMNSGYLANLLIGLNYAEGLNLSFEYLFSEKAAQTMHRISSSRPLSEWKDYLGNELSLVIHPDFLAPNYNNNPKVIRFMDALDRNSFIQTQQPWAPIKLYHAPLDNLIDFSSSEALHRLWPNSTLIELTSSSHEMGCVEFWARFLGVWNFMQ